MLIFLGLHKRLEVGADVHTAAARKKFSLSNERLASETVSVVSYSERSATVSLAEGNNDGTASTRALAGSLLHYRMGDNQSVNSYRTGNNRQSIHAIHTDSEKSVNIINLYWLMITVFSKQIVHLFLLFKEGRDKWLFPLVFSINFMLLRLQRKVSMMAMQAPMPWQEASSITEWETANQSIATEQVRSKMIIIYLLILVFDESARADATRRMFFS